MSNTAAAFSVGQRTATRVRNWVVALTSLGCALTANAQFDCTASIIGLLAYNDGSVNLLHSARGDWTMICNLAQPVTRVNTVGPETCAVWYATLLRAKKNNQAVRFYYSGTGSCATLNIYSAAPVPVYIGEMN